MQHFYINYAPTTLLMAITGCFVIKLQYTFSWSQPFFLWLHFAQRDSHVYFVVGRVGSLFELYTYWFCPQFPFADWLLETLVGETEALREYHDVANND